MMIAKAALGRVDIHGYAHQGAHIFRHSLATELLRSGATLPEIGHLLRRKSHASALRITCSPFSRRCEWSNYAEPITRRLP